MAVFESVADAIGKTPIVKLKRFGDLGKHKHNLWAKLEYLNPGGSVKDRIAKNMIEQAELNGKLKPGSTIIEATAGNTGIGLAMLAALKGYKLIAIVSQKVSLDKVKLLKALGAEVVITPSGKKMGDPDHFLSIARRLTKERAGWFVDQFYNPDNAQVHYDVTGPEIWEQTEGQIDAIVAGAGTGGTLSGAGRFLKEKKPSVKVILADPVGSILADLYDDEKTTPGQYVVEGIGQDFLPGNFHQDVVDLAIRVTDEQSLQAAYDLMKLEGLFGGSSSGCIAAAASSYCIGLEGSGKNVLAILPDGGRGYMSTIYDDSWIKEKFPNWKFDK